MPDRVTRGISPEVLEKIGVKKPYAGFYAMLRRLKPQRQRRVADLIAMSADRTQSFLILLLVASKDSDQIGSKRLLTGIGKRHLEEARSAFRKIEDAFLSSAETYREDAYALATTRAYVRALLQNRRMLSYLKAVHPESLKRLEEETL